VAIAGSADGLDIDRLDELGGRGGLSRFISGNLAAGSLGGLGVGHCVHNRLDTHNAGAMGCFAVH